MRDKFQSTPSFCYFLGYSPSHKAYKCSRLSDSQILISRHVKFYEGIFPFKDYKIKKEISWINSHPILPLPIDKESLANEYVNSLGNQQNISHVSHPNNSVGHPQLENKHNSTAQDYT